MRLDRDWDGTGGDAGGFGEGGGGRRPGAPSRWTAITWASCISLWTATRILPGTPGCAFPPGAADAGDQRGLPGSGGGAGMGRDPQRLSMRTRARPDLARVEWDGKPLGPGAGRLGPGETPSSPRMPPGFAKACWAAQGAHPGGPGMGAPCVTAEIPAGSPWKAMASIRWLTGRAPPPPAPCLSRSPGRSAAGRRMARFGRPGGRRHPRIRGSRAGPHRRACPCLRASWIRAASSPSRSRCLRRHPSGCASSTWRETSSACSRRAARAGTPWHGPATMGAAGRLPPGPYVISLGVAGRGPVRKVVVLAGGP